MDSNWEARISNFGLLSVNQTELNGMMENNVYKFGIVLLEILIRRGRAAAIIDRNLVFPRKVEPKLKLADVAEIAPREDENERPSIADIVVLLDQIVKD